MRNVGGVLLAAAGLLVGSVVGDVDPIIIKGTKFFYKTNGTQFFIKGLAYQQDYVGPGAAGGDAAGGFNDPLADPAGCKRDIPLLKELETNVVRVYAVNPNLNHDDCMNMMADAGIYVISDLSAPNDSINSDDPEWTDDLYAYYASVVDVMAQYTNTLGFFAGNEVANAPNNTASAPFVKAAVRDMKAYIKQQGYRQIGVGYATDDNSAVRVQLADYFNCGDQTDAIDFWGYNIYSWCGNSNYVESGYKERTEEFSSYSVPAFFAEYGCNLVEPRTFTEVLALYGDQMTPVFSGGIVYEYFQASNDYGIVTIGSNNKATKLVDFDNLSTQIAKVHPSSTAMSDYTPSNSPQACPTSNVDFRAEATPLPPTPNEELCSCMYSALNCVVDPGTSQSDYKKLFSYVCAHDSKACAGIQHDSGDGKYGAYSMCNSTQQLGWAFNSYYLNQGKASTACKFDGNAKLQSPANVDGTCSSLLSQAGGVGTGTVTSQPTVTGAGAASNGGSGGSGSGSGSSSSSSSGAASALNVPQAQSGLLPMAFIVILAAVSGMGIILL